MAITIKQPREHVVIGRPELVAPRKHLEELRAEDPQGLESSPASMDYAQRNVLSQSLNTKRQIEQLKLNRRKGSEIAYEDGDFYKNSVKQGIELSEKYKDIKHGKSKVGHSFIPKKLKDYDKNLEAVWKSEDFSLEAKTKFTKSLALGGEKQYRRERDKGYDQYENQLKQLEAKQSDIGRKLRGQSVQAIGQSFAQGVELLVSPIRKVAQGDTTGMAYQEASRLSAYHEPDGTIDKYVHLMAANAAPMGAALGAAMVPGVGPVLSAAIIGTPAATDTYYDLKRAGAEDSTAYSAGLAVGITTAATEMYLGKLFSKIPVAGKLFPDEGLRGARLKKILGPLGRKAKLPDVLDRQIAGKITQQEMGKVFANAMSDMSRLGVLKDISQATTTEAFTGGVEEWLQQGMQMGLTELATKHDGLDSMLPKNEDGSYNVALILEEMNDAFVAGMVLEGTMAGGGISLTAKGRWDAAKHMEGAKNYVRSTAGKMKVNEDTRQAHPYGNVRTQAEVDSINADITGKNYYEGDVNQLSEQGLDFIARTMTVMQMKAQKDGKKVDSRKTLGDAVTKFQEDPMQAYLIDNGKNVTIEELVPGKAYTMSDGVGGKIVVAKSDGPLTNAAGEQVMAKYRSGGDADVVEVSGEVWKMLEDKGLGKDVVMLNHYAGSTMVHELSHVIVQNSPAEVGDQLLNTYDKSQTQSEDEIAMWKDRDIDRAAEGATTQDEVAYQVDRADARAQESESARIGKLEAPSEAVEQRIGNKAYQGVTGKISDTYAKLDVAIRGKSASESSKKRNYENEVIQSARTGSAVRTDHLGVAAPLDIGPRIGRIGRKTADVAQVGYQATSDANVGDRARSGGSRIMGIGKRAINRAANAVGKGTELNQSMERMTATPQFKQWFGGSKVVDKQGSPLVVYHGTGASERFDTFKGDEEGIWFSSDPGLAGHYSGEDTPTGREYADARLMPVFLNMQNPYNSDMDDSRLLQEIGNDGLKEAGYDGVIAGTVYVVFDSNQIKSTFNKGTFSESGTMLDQPMPQRIGGKKTTEQVAFDRFQKDKVRKYGSQKFKKLYEDFSTGAIGKTPFADVQGEFDTYMSNISKQTKSPEGLVGQLKVLSDNLRPVLDADEALYDDSSEIVARTNAEALSEFQQREAEGKGNQFDAGASEASARDMSSSNTTVRLVSKRRNLAEPNVNLPLDTPSFRPVTREILGQASRVYHNDVLFPATPAAYKEMFGSVATDESVYNDEGYVERLSVGDDTFYLSSPDSVGRMKKMSDALGPMWAIQAEASKIKQVNKDVDDGVMGEVHSVQTTLRDIETAHYPVDAKHKPFRAALHALYTYSQNKLHVIKGKSGTDYEINAQIQANALVDFFKGQGVPSDGSDVLYSLLPNQSGRNERDAMYSRDAMQSEIWGKDVDAKPTDMQEVSTEVTAESLSRELIRELGELLSTNMTESELKGTLGAAKNYGVTVSQAGTVARAINNRAPLGRAGVVNKIAEAGRLDAESTIGELLKAKVDKFNGNEKWFHNGMEGVAHTNAIGVTPSDVAGVLKRLTAKKLMGDTDNALDRGTASPSERANLLRDLLNLESIIYGMQKSTKDIGSDQFSEIMRYVELDPNLDYLEKNIRQTQDGIDLNMSMDTVSGDEATKVVAAALTHIDFADQLFGVSGMRKIKAQIESMKLEKSYMEIFGMEPEYKMRDIIKNTILGGKDGKNNQSRTTAGDYSLAMQFAASAMNTDTPADSLVEMGRAISDVIAELEAKDKLTNDENFALGQYKNYLSVMGKANEIVDSDGEYGQKLNTWLKTDYKTQSHGFYDDVVAKSKFAGDKQNFYSPAVFVQEQTEETPEHLMSQITGRMIGKQYDDLTPHLKEGRVLKFDNFIINALEAQNQSIEALSNQQMIQRNLVDGFFSLKPQAGYSVMKPSGSKVYTLKVVVDGKVKAQGIPDFDKAREFAAGYKDAKIEGEYRDVYAPDEIANYFNKITATSPLRNNKFLMGLMSVNAKLKAIRINFGMFHRRGLLWSAIMAGELNPDYKDQKGAWNKLKSRFDYTNRREAGMEMMQEFSPEMMALNYYGMTLFQVQDIGKENLQNKTRIEKFVAGGKRGEATRIAGKGVKAFENMTSRLQGELFGVFGSTLKTATAFNELVALQTKHQEQITKEKQESQKTGKTSKHFQASQEVLGDAAVEFKDYYSAKEEEIYRTVAGLANADFGGLHMGRMGVSKGAQDVMRLLLLGPDWTYSNVISALKAVPGKKVSGNIGGASTNFAGTELERKVYQAFWLRIIGRSLAIATAINLLMAGIDDDSVAERLKKAKARGKFNVLKADISPLIHLLGGDRETDHYLNTLGHFLDPAKIAVDPIRMAYHKSSTVAKPIADLISGTRYDHKRPTRISQIGQEGLATWKSGKRGPLAPAELPSYALWQAIQLLPIQAKNVFDVMGGEENVITSLMKTGAGLDVSRTYER